MRILMTQRKLRDRGGTEIFTIEVAVELRKRGHEVAVYSPAIGELAELLFSAGIPVKTRLSELPGAPDIIHGQHHLQTMAAMARFESTPAIYYCHGGSPWVEKPPIHRGIHAYVTTCTRIIPRLESELDIARKAITAIPNFVNLGRFSRLRIRPPLPRRALLFGNGFLPGAETRLLESACEELGLTLDKIGAGFQNPRPRPEIFLLEYDLVFATGKCALEAMACGCAVIPIIPGQAGHLITPASFEQWQETNFSPRLYSSADQISLEWLRHELAGYSSADVHTLCGRVRSEHTLTAAVDRLESLYRQAIAAHSRQPAPFTARDFAPYLEVAGRESDELWDECNRLRNPARFEKKIRQLESRIRDQADTWERAVATLRPSILGRWFLSRIRRATTEPASENESCPAFPPQNPACGKGAETPS